MLESSDKKVKNLAFDVFSSSSQVTLLSLSLPLYFFLLLLCSLSRSLPCPLSLSFLLSSSHSAAFSTLLFPVHSCPFHLDPVPFVSSFSLPDPLSPSSTSLSSLPIFPQRLASMVEIRAQSLKLIREQMDTCEFTSKEAALVSAKKVIALPKPLP